MNRKAALFSSQDPKYRPFLSNSGAHFLSQGDEKTQHRTKPLLGPEVTNWKVLLRSNTSSWEKKLKDSQKLKIGYLDR